MLRQVDSVMVVGCGGIGSWLIPPLLRYLNAEGFQGRICLWDGDKFSSNNALRQDFPMELINWNKAVAAVLNGRRMLGHELLNVVAFDEYVTKNNLDRCIVENSCIITCVDNHPARALINKAAMALNNVTVISTGNEKLDGNAHVYVRRKAKDITSDLFVRHPEIETAKRGERRPGCIEEIGRGETQLLVTNYIAASCALLAFFTLWNYGERFGAAKIRLLPQELYFDIGELKLIPILQGE